MEGNYISFRKAKVGGFNKKDVVSYIEKMRNDFFDYKVAVESTIDKLNAKVRELELACEDHKEQVRELEAACEDQKEQIKEIIVEVPVIAENSADPLSDINEATSQLKIVADELCRNLSDFMLKMSTKDCSVEHNPLKPEIFDNVSAYIEETAKEIFEEAPVSVEKETESSDMVSEILNSSMNFCFSKEETVASEAKSAESEKDKDILDCLSLCSFLG